MRSECEFAALYRVNFQGAAGQVDLTNCNFIIDHEFRDRGLGSWMMQQLVFWDKTLPGNTRGKSIETSPVDENENDMPGNAARHDLLWVGVGFRFESGNYVFTSSQ